MSAWRPPRQAASLRLARLVIKIVARGIPLAGRAAWIQEWTAELCEHAGSESARHRRPLRLSLVSIADALAVRALARHRGKDLTTPPSGGTPMMGLITDVQSAVRALVAAPGLTAALVAVLAVGIAANTAAFTFANDLLWRELPVDDGERFVRIYNGYAHGFQWGSSSYPTYEELSTMPGVFDGVLGEAFLPLGVENQGRAERIWASLVTPEYFRMLRVSPAAGRFFPEAEARVAGRAAWAVISHGFWERHYGASASAVGSRLDVNGFPLTVIGVAPRSFLGTQIGIVPDLWSPVTMQGQLLPEQNWLDSRRQRQLWLIGRLAPGASVQQVRTALAAQASSLKARFPQEYDSFASFNVLPEVEGGFHPFYRAPFASFLTLLMAVVGIVLLVACTNAAGLMIARSAARSREIAIRRAIGAGHWRLTRQLFTESLLIATLAGGAGILLARLAVRFVAGFQPPTDIPLAFSFGLDGRVLTFTLLVTAATAILFGLLPAVRAARADLGDVLKGRGGADIRSSRLRSATVVGQVAMSLALLIGASLFLRSLTNATGVDLGYDTAGLHLASIDLGPRHYSAETGTELYRSLLAGLRADPEIEAVALAAAVPFALDPSPTRIAPEGMEPTPDGSLPSVEFNVITPGFLDTVATRLVQGRDFNADDQSGRLPVVIVSDKLATDFWPNHPAVGQRVIAFGTTWNVIGVAADTRFRTLSGETMPFFYLPLAQRYSSEATIYVRTRASAEVEPLLRKHLSALDGSVPLFGLKTFRQQVGVALLPARLAAAVVGFFGVLTLGLAAVGVYGVLAYSVQRRRPELGVRMAVGAAGRDVIALMVAEGARLALAGVLVGLVLGFGLTRLLAGLLYGVSPNDPASYLLTTIALLLTALVATLLPALRAAAVDPVTVLRE